MCHAGNVAERPASRAGAVGKEVGYAFGDLVELGVGERHGQGERQRRLRRVLLGPSVASSELPCIRVVLRPIEPVRIELGIDGGA